MKGFPLCLIVLSLLLASCAAPKMAPQFRSPSTAVIGSEIKSAKTHVEKARVIYREIEKKLPENLRLDIVEQSDALLKELEWTQEALNKAEGAREQVQQQNDELAKDANVVANAYNVQKAKFDALVKKYHRAKLILSAAIALVVGFLMLKIMKLIPPPYNIIAVGAAPLAVGFISYLIL